MVHLLSWCQFAFLLTPFAKGMLIYIPVANALPSPVVAFLHGGVALIAFISFCLFFGVLLAKPSVRQLWTARVGTRPLGLKGH